MKRFFRIAIPASIPILLAPLVAAQQPKPAPSHVKANTPASAAAHPSGGSIATIQCMTLEKPGTAQQHISVSLSREVTSLSLTEQEGYEQGLKSLYGTQDRTLNFTEEDAEKVRVIHPLLTPQIMAKVKTGYPRMTPETMARVKLRYASPLVKPVK